MAIYGLADLHLAISNPDKDMSVFGRGWDGYMEKIKKNCNEKVGPEDTILMPGDLSWVMYLDNGREDFGFIDSLPGTKLIGRGNHDYFWTTVAKMEKWLAEQGFSSIKVIRNNAVRVEDSLVTGTRGWKLPIDDNFDEDDRKILDREIIRTGLCIDSLRKEDPEHKLRWILMLHYPPLLKDCLQTEFTELIEKAGVDLCIFGHLHGRAHANMFEGQKEENGTKYVCVSGDYIKFEPVKL